MNKLLMLGIALVVLVPVVEGAAVKRDSATTNPTPKLTPEQKKKDYLHKYLYTFYVYQWFLVEQKDVLRMADNMLRMSRIAKSGAYSSMYSQLTKQEFDAAKKLNLATNLMEFAKRNDQRYDKKIKKASIDFINAIAVNSNLGSRNVTYLLNFLKQEDPRKAQNGAEIDLDKFKARIWYENAPNNKFFDGYHIFSGMNEKELNNAINSFISAPATMTPDFKDDMATDGQITLVVPIEQIQASCLFALKFWLLNTMEDPYRAGRYFIKKEKREEFSENLNLLTRLLDRLAQFTDALSKESKTDDFAKYVTNRLERLTAQEKMDIKEDMKTSIESYLYEFKKANYALLSMICSINQGFLLKLNSDPYKLRDQIGKEIYPDYDQQINNIRKNFETTLQGLARDLKPVMTLNEGKPSEKMALNFAYAAKKVTDGLQAFQSAALWALNTGPEVIRLARGRTKLLYGALEDSFPAQKLKLGLNYNIKRYERFTPTTMWLDSLLGLSELRFNTEKIRKAALNLSNMKNKAEKNSVRELQVALFGDMAYSVGGLEYANKEDLKSLFKDYVAIADALLSVINSYAVDKKTLRYVNYQLISIIVELAKYLKLDLEELGLGERVVAEKYAQEMKEPLKGIEKAVEYFEKAIDDAKKKPETDALEQAVVQAFQGFFNAFS